MTAPVRYGERFYRSRWNNIGTMLAVGAGILSYAFLTWSVGVPQGRGNFGVFWGLSTFAAAGAYLYAAWTAETNWLRSRIILIGVPLAQIGVGVVASLLMSTYNGIGEWVASLYDIVPAVVALIAGILIHPPRGEVDERTRLRQG